MVYKSYHECSNWFCHSPCPGFVLRDAKDDEIIPGWQNLIDAEGNIISEAGDAPTIPKPKVELNFFDNCGVADLAAQIKLDINVFKKSRIKEPLTDIESNRKEAIKTAQPPKTSSRKEQLLAKVALLEKENYIRRQIVSQH